VAARAASKIPRHVSQKGAMRGNLRDVHAQMQETVALIARDRFIPAGEVRSVALFAGRTVIRKSGIAVEKGGTRIVPVRGMRFVLGYLAVFTARR
jgi:hypothetical protein